MPDPDDLAAEIIENVEAALEGFGRFLWGCEAYLKAKDMKTKQFLFGLALGLGLMAAFGFQGRGNEGSGEVLILRVYQVENTSITVFYPDGTMEIEKHEREKGVAGRDERDKYLAIALTRFRKEGFSVKSAVASPRDNEITYVLEK